MKSAFDVYFGGSVSSRAQVAERIRKLKQPVEVQDLDAARDKLNSSEFVGPLMPRHLLIERLRQPQKKRSPEWSATVSKSAPYVGDIFGY